MYIKNNFKIKSYIFDCTWHIILHKIKIKTPQCKYLFSELYRLCGTAKHWRVLSVSQDASSWNPEQNILWSACGIIWVYSGNYASLNRKRLFVMLEEQVRRRVSTYFFLLLTASQMIWKLSMELTGMLSRPSCFSLTVWFYNVFGDIAKYCSSAHVLYTGVIAESCYIYHYCRH